MACSWRYVSDMCTCATANHLDNEAVPDGSACSVVLLEDVEQLPDSLLVLKNRDILNATK